MQIWELYGAQVCHQLYLIRYTIENLLNFGEKPKATLTVKDFLVDRKPPAKKPDIYAELSPQEKKKAIAAKSKRGWFGAFAGMLKTKKD